MAETKEKVGEKKAQVRSYRLLAGAHMDRDYDAKPTKVRALNPDTGEMEVAERYPSKTYSPGQVVTTDKDLVGLFGENKFKEVVKRGRRYHDVTDVDEDDDTYQQGDPTPLNAQEPRTFPHGQVYQGHPATGGGAQPGEGVRQFSQTPEEAKEIAEKHADRLPQPKEEKDKYWQRQEEAAAREGKAPPQRTAGKKGAKKGRGAAKAEKGSSLDEERDFHSMKKDELLQYAQDNEVDLGDAHTKEEIVKKLEKSRR